MVAYKMNNTINKELKYEIVHELGKFSYLNSKVTSNGRSLKIYILAKSIRKYVLLIEKKSAQIRSNQFKRKKK